MRLIPSSFNGFLFQQGTRVASTWNIPYDWTVSGVTTNAIALSQKFPQYVSKNYAGGIKVISVVFNDVDADRDSLIIAMDVLGETQHQLFASDRFGNIWYVNAVCIGVNEESTDAGTAAFGVAFDVDDPMWKKYIPSTKTITTLYGAGSDTLVPLGNQPALPKIKITPISGSGTGFNYRAFFVINNPGDREIYNKPYDITDGGFDTATLVSGGYMLASGDDLRIYSDGAEVPRWLTDMNTANTKIWINLNAIKSVAVTLKTAIADTGDVTTIDVEPTLGNIDAFAYLRVTSTHLCLIGNEIFQFGRSVGATMQLLNCSRASRSTIAEAHSVGDTITFLPCDIWMYYDYAAITPYVADDTTKPIIDLDASTNANPVFTNFSQATGLRTGTFAPFTNSPYASQPIWGIYTATEMTYADPSSAMGGAIKWAPVNWYAKWSLYDPCGILSVISATGKKYKHHPQPLASWFSATLEKSLDGILYETVWAETNPVLNDEWVALDTHETVSFSGSYPYIKFSVNATTDMAGIDASFMHEISGLSLELDTDNIPTVAMLTPVGIDVNLAITIEDAVTGLSITLEAAMQYGEVLTVDVKEKTITLSDGTNMINSLMDMPVRTEWFTLLPQEDNVITVTTDGTVAVEFEYEDRAL